jgi:hypothetical protein
LLWIHSSLSNNSWTKEYFSVFIWFAFWLIFV